MKIFSILLFGILYFNNFSYSQETEGKTTPTSISVLLNFKGNGNIVSDISVELIKVYEGRAKMLNERGSTRAEYPIRIKVLDADLKQVYEGFFESPLLEEREVFEENGQNAENFKFKHNAGILNVRFPINEINSKVLTMICYQVDGDNHETLLKTLTLYPNEKN